MQALSIAMSKPVQYSIRVSVALALAVVFIASESGRAFAYSCSVNHCYGTTTWSNLPEYSGSYTDILMAPISCNPSSCAPKDKGFINDEMWLIDDLCVNGGHTEICWIETGYYTGSVDKSSPGTPVAVVALNPSFFWADMRPGQSFTFVLAGDIPDSQYGTKNHFVIVKDGRTTPNPFLVFIYNDSLSTFFGESLNNRMNGNEINIGQELAFDGGAIAPQVTFTRNIFAVRPVGKDYVFWYNAQTDRGTVSSPNPPTGRWDIAPPTSGSSPEGGQFSTSCC